MSCNKTGGQTYEYKRQQHTSEENTELPIRRLARSKW